MPLSLTSTIILGILLIFTGLFILPRMQGRHLRTLATTTLLAGIVTAGISGKLVSDSFALQGGDCDIKNPNSTTGCPNVFGIDFVIINNSDNEIVVTFTADIFSNQGALRKNRTLKIVELVKGPTQRSVVAAYPNCSFPQTLAVGEACQFLHSQIDHGLD